MKKLTNHSTSPAKECAYVAIMVALIMGVQTLFSAVPSVEFVTVLFVCYSFVFGVKRGMICATTFSLLRCLIFGVFPNVIVLYLIYYNLLTLAFALLGKVLKMPKFLFLVIIIALLFTALFTLLDDLITPLMLGYSKKATKIYFTASLSFMIPQTIFTTISVGLLFLPLTKVFTLSKNMLTN